MKHSILQSTITIMLLVLLLLACTKDETSESGSAGEATPDAMGVEDDLTPPVSGNSPVDTGISTTNSAPEIKIDENAFECLDNMVKIRHFFVDNLLGDLKATVAVAESTEGGTYPPGSVVQLVPTEVMVKHNPGWNAATRDWEFFELDVSAQGSKIRNRGFVDVVNRFGGNCFACHIKAKPQYDLICELEHGCDTIPITREMIADIQAKDPRC